MRVADEFHRRYGSPHLYTTCRTQYGGILLATGRWEQAEEELQAALRIGRAAEPALHCEALAGSSPSSASRRAGPRTDAPATRARRARRDAGMRQEHGEMSEKRTEAVGGHAVVIGASMAGLLAARGSPTPTSG